jgi:hypothetical protein
MTRGALAVGAIAVALCLSGMANAASPEDSLHLTLVSAGEGQLGPRSSLSLK